MTPPVFGIGDWTKAAQEAQKTLREQLLHAEDLERDFRRASSIDAEFVDVTDQRRLPAPDDLERRQAEWDAMYAGDGGMGELSLQGFKIPPRPTR